MKTIISTLLAIIISVANYAQSNNNMILNKLTDEEKRVIIDKGTEAPFVGKYTNFKGEGTYICKLCNAPLYKSADKFDSHCGWPAFDDEIEGAIKRQPDADGRRVEIVCAKCGAHLGHVFEGERFTRKNIRHCVNSISMKFIPKEEEAIFAGGCFWGVEHLLAQQKGVKSVESGYIGGHIPNPTYEEVCDGNTGHAEAVRVIFDPLIVDYQTLAKLFFEIHDPEQIDRQGPDKGTQYRSEIFYTSPKQQDTANKLIKQLTDKGYKVATKVTKATRFYPAEKYHQDYYKKTGKEPYCHAYQKRF